MIKSIALWERVSKKGDTYYSCCVEMNSGDKYFFNVIQNKRKEKDNQPDYKSIGQCVKEIKKEDK